MNKLFIFLFMLFLGQALQGQIIQNSIGAEKTHLKDNNIHYFINEATTFKTEKFDEKKKWLFVILNEEGQRVEEIHYNEEKKIEASTEFIYNKDYKLQDIIYRSPEGEIMGTLEFSYDLSGRHAQTVKRLENNIVSKKFLRYKPDGTLKHLQIVKPKTSGPKPYMVGKGVVAVPQALPNQYKENYDYSNGKITAIYGLNIKITYTYHSSGQIEEKQQSIAFPYGLDLIYKESSVFNEFGLVEEKKNYSIYSKDEKYDGNQKYTYFTKDDKPIAESGFEAPEYEQYQSKKRINQNSLYLNKVEEFPGGLEGLQKLTQTFTSRYNSKVHPRNYGFVDVKLSINQDGTVKDYTILNQTNATTSKYTKKILKKQFPLWKPEGAEQNSGPFETIIRFSF